MAPTVAPDNGKDNIARHSRSSERAPKRKRRQSTVYDAVAGRVAYDRFLSSRPFVASTRDTLSSTTVAVPPDEVLFRRKAAPTRYEEADIYFGAAAPSQPNHTGPHGAPLRSLPDLESLLPSSDLVKALHAYAADFYAAATEDGGKGDWRSLDETALLAVGVLMEEMAAEALGETGDLVLVEGEWSGERIGCAMEGRGDEDEERWVRGLGGGTGMERSVLERTTTGRVKREGPGERKRR